MPITARHPDICQPELLEGMAYLRRSIYLARALIWIAGCALGALIASRRFQACLALVATLAQLALFFAWYDRLA